MERERYEFDDDGSEAPSLPRDDRPLRTPDDGIANFMRFPAESVLTIGRFDRYESQSARDANHARRVRQILIICFVFFLVTGGLLFAVSRSLVMFIPPAVIFLTGAIIALVDDEGR